LGMFLQLFDALLQFQQSLLERSCSATALWAFASRRNFGRTCSDCGRRGGRCWYGALNWLLANLRGAGCARSRGLFTNLRGAGCARSRGLFTNLRGAWGARSRGLFTNLRGAWGAGPCLRRGCGPRVRRCCSNDLLRRGSRGRPVFRGSRGSGRKWRKSLACGGGKGCRPRLRLSCLLGSGLCRCDAGACRSRADLCWPQRRDACGRGSPRR
jgi:hypothetical protein